ncbi:efflux RND transporter periplasmic adaptor subunit [Limnobacter humi]|uniref:Efflux RND transporter periplasmic adaptor subunit n=1 Tax=Limnobacter humi TaxID=1778671 RepID=A0ABT1WG09_9BURK|nr:efflux RND transporter periplasmic adaptor subunit [Limnobacter humi]MCQ8896458.1 efflux RND transporter periplasmic adaptor subunit [Limnobacter humi]
MLTASRTATALAVLATVSVVALSGCGKKEVANAATAPNLPKVAVVKVEAAPTSLFTELPGRTSPYLIAEVRPQVTGILKTRQFTEGADVKAGTSLYQIDASTYQAAYNSAKAALAKAEANLVSADVRNTRFQDLAKQNAVSQQERDDAFATLKQAQADVQSAKAAVQAAEINLGYTQVRAPISGRIGRSNVTAGALVQQGQAQALSTIQQLDPIYVDLTQSTTELLQLKRDLASGVLKNAGKDAAKVKLMLEDGSEYAQEGKLQFSEATVDPNTGTVTLRAVFPNPNKQLLPGMYVRAVLQEGVRQNAILVPQKGIARDNTGAAVAYVLGEGNVVEKRKVVTERAIGDKWLVADGLKDGDRLVVEGIQKIKPGQPAEIIQPAGK